MSPARRRRIFTCSPASRLRVPARSRITSWTTRYPRPRASRRSPPSLNVPIRRGRLVCHRLSFNTRADRRGSHRAAQRHRALARCCSMTSTETVCPMRRTWAMGVTGSCTSRSTLGAVSGLPSTPESTSELRTLLRCTVTCSEPVLTGSSQITAARFITIPITPRATVFRESARESRSNQATNTCSLTSLATDYRT